MFEISEMYNFKKQMEKSLLGKTIIEGTLGNSEHKFVWYNREPEEFSSLIKNRKIESLRVKGRWLLLDLEKDYVLVFGECGGKIILHNPDEKLPAKYHLYLKFSNESFLTATTQMWGAYELYRKGEELERDYIKDMKPTPMDAEFTFSYFNDLIDLLNLEGKRSIKSLLTQEQLIPGLGNAVAQDIMFKAGLHPRYSLKDMPEVHRHRLYDAIIFVVNEIIRKGGRNDEYDLYGKQGGYHRLMDKNAAGNPCPVCNTE
ncbi:MAG: hypothetical protein K9N06_01175 [Candidatus Cloacimonetes bacterium]|nr:hypothetical protein [Candidatus Cloacimonadota bacterium]